MLWMQAPGEEAAATIAFSKGIAEFCSGRDMRGQVAPMRENSVYHSVPFFRSSSSVIQKLAEAVRKYLIFYLAGKKDAEMMERSMQAIACMGVGAGLEKILVVRDTGRKGKAARSILVERAC